MRQERSFFTRPAFPIAFLTAFLLCSAISIRAASAASAPSDVLAHGNHDTHGGEEFLWVAKVTTEQEPGAAPVTVTRFFALRGGDTVWQQWGGGAPARAIALASRGTELAALLDDGSWLLLSDDSVSTGRSLPVPGAGLVTLADDGESIWAIAKIPGGIASLRPAPLTFTGSPTIPASEPTAMARPATVPATSPSLVGPTTEAEAPTIRTTQPAASPPAALDGPVIAPAPETRFALVRLGPEGWQGQIDIPANVARPGDPVTLALIDGDPYLAVRPAGTTGPVRLYRLVDPRHAASTTPATTQPVSGWVAVCDINLPADAQDFRLLNGTPIPVVWVRGSSGPDLLYFCRSINVSPPSVPLESTRGTPPEQRAGTYALGHILGLFSKGGALYEQPYDRFSGEPVDKTVPLSFPASSASSLTLWRYAVVTGSMLFAIGASFRRRDQLRALKIDPKSLPLAPALPRLAAGIFDALPVIAAWLFYYQRMGPGDLFGVLTGSAAVADPFVELALWVSFAIYVLHTLISELLIGRTLGKVIFGLRVAGIDGKPPTRGQIVTRNLLRVIDAGLIFLPALLVPFSPLRQRAGDTAAGTLVVTAQPQNQEDADQSDEASRK